MDVDPLSLPVHRASFAIVEGWHLILSRISYGMSSEGLILHVLRWDVFLESSKHILGEQARTG